MKILGILNILRDPGWGAFEAIGTVAAVITALYFGLRRPDKPKITLYHQRDIEDMSAEYAKHYWVVENKGKITATDVHLKMIKVWDSKGIVIYEEEDLTASTKGFGKLFSGDKKFTPLFIDDHGNLKPTFLDVSFRGLTYFQIKVVGDNFPAINQVYQCREMPEPGFGTLMVRKEAPKKN